MGNANSTPVTTHYKVEKEDQYTLETLLTENIDLACEDLGSEVLGCSDDIFASCSNLINSHEPIKKYGEFTEIGAWYDGWESKRHNTEEFDWATIRLNFPGSIKGLDIDTSTFSIGNSAPYASVEACYAEESQFDEDFVPEKQWETILPKVKITPDSKNIFTVRTGERSVYNLIRLKMYPDGGIARLRVYGTVAPPLKTSSRRLTDLVFVGNGGRVVSCSNQHFSKPSNLLLPGRGVDMRDGWETARSRIPGNSEWVVIALGKKGTLNKIIVDTKNFIGNYPQKVQVFACRTQFTDPAYDRNVQWLNIVGPAPCEANTLHEFDVKWNNLLFTHIKVSIFPDGGVKRIRAMGHFEHEQVNVTPASVKMTAPSDVEMVHLEVTDSNISASPYNLRSRKRSFSEAMSIKSEPETSPVRLRRSNV